jgi:hypothetical protein
MPFDRALFCEWISQLEMSLALVHLKVCAWTPTVPKASAQASIVVVIFIFYPQKRVASNHYATSACALVAN